jgi:hypothetical protein
MLISLIPPYELFLASSAGALPSRVGLLAF